MKTGGPSDPVKNLAQELNALRSLVDEITRQFEMNTKARIDDMVNALSGAGKAEEGAT